MSNFSFVSTTLLSPNLGRGVGLLARLEHYAHLLLPAVPEVQRNPLGFQPSGKQLRLAVGRGRERLVPHVPGFDELRAGGGVALLPRSPLRGGGGSLEPCWKKT